jgi:hypothetical protein
LEVDDKGRLRLSVKAIGGIELQTPGGAAAIAEATAQAAAPAEAEDKPAQ